MNADDLDLAPKKTLSLDQKLDALSVEELENFIAEKEAEIAAARQKMKQRSGALLAAQALFGKT